MKNKIAPCSLLIAAVLMMCIFTTSCNVIGKLKSDVAAELASTLESIETEDTYTKGTLTSTTFDSEFLNIKFAVPEGYVMIMQKHQRFMK